MSTNCIQCVKNKRTGPDLLCDECRHIADESNEPTWERMYYRAREECARAEVQRDKAIAKLAEFESVAKTLHTRRQWLGQVREEDPRDDEAVESARHDFDQAVDLLCKMRDPRWSDDYMVRVAETNRKMGDLMTENARLRRMVEGVQG